MNAIRNGEVSFWHADMGGLPTPRRPLAGDTTVDVCIVGAGFTGLWTAYYLKQAEPSLSIAVIEREFAGFGASGRNGGWLSGDFTWSRDKYLSNGTREGVISFERQLRETVDEVIRVCETEGIEADIHRTDCLTYACSPAQMQRMRAALAEERAWGIGADRATLLEGPEALSRIRGHSWRRAHPAGQAGARTGQRGRTAWRFDL